jgi:hypothetical protein
MLRRRASTCWVRRRMPTRPTLARGLRPPPLPLLLLCELAGRPGLRLSLLLGPSCLPMLATSCSRLTCRGQAGSSLAAQ